MAGEWHYTSKGQQCGPVSSQKLMDLAAIGVITPTDHVWKEGMADWVSASKVKGLFTEPIPAQPPPPPPAPPRFQAREIPIRLVKPAESGIQKLARWVTIGWSAFCLFGVVFGIINAAGNSGPTYSDAGRAGQAIGVGCGLAIWMIIWAVIVGPALAIWLLADKKQ